MVLFTDHTKISKSLKKTLRNTDIHISMDRAFDQVMLACSAPRSNQPLDPENSSWIHPQMIAAYTSLHQQGFAHSVECWQDNKLIGGLYGVAIGHAFFGESMFSMVRDSSKIALIALCQQLSRWGYPLIDCQVHSDHLASLGAKEISRHDFIKQLNHLCPQAQELTNWQLDKDLSNIL
jgi:leucyl/phenylalanyl-tRNA---protein transferase